MRVFVKGEEPAAEPGCLRPPLPRSSLMLLSKPNLCGKYDTDIYIAIKWGWTLADELSRVGAGQTLISAQPHKRQ